MFIYYNHNPNGYHIPDCVIRAISTATGLSYFDTIHKLKTNANIFQCDELCKCCYEKLLDYDFGLPHYKGNGEVAAIVSEDFPDNILLLRMDGHLSCSMFGDIVDIWDCSSEPITDFWIVE